MIPKVRTETRLAASSFQDAADALAAFMHDSANLGAIDQLGATIARRLRDGHKVMACGNGGSSADAMHFCEELTGRFRDDRPPLAAIACTDVGHITCTANDYGYEHVFSRWVEGLGAKGDVLVVLSTSGNSMNAVLAVEAARQKGMTTVGLFGKDGGRLKGKCDHEWIAPGATADRIQEIHMLLLHVLIEVIEANLA